jgi:hypothetical protein
MFQISESFRLSHHYGRIPDTDNLKGRKILFWAQHFRNMTVHHSGENGADRKQRKDKGTRLKPSKICL